MTVASLIVSIVAALTGIFALVITIVHKSKEQKHSFYYSLNTKVSNALFTLFPKAYNDFIDKNQRIVFSEKYNDLETFFAEIYSVISSLENLKERQTKIVFSNTSDLEDCLMSLRNNGYDEQKVSQAQRKVEALYESLKRFCLCH